ncbi:MAG: hypothetical protein IJ691_08610 [Lachnospiraceae bacterium]|nr:hypothetical protein [Lachnospiraceae bacterium]
MRLFVGFKGKNNTSRILVEELSPVHLLLTNSFTGLRKDIDSISKKYDHVFIFGVDKTLTSEVRIEKYADKEGIRYASKLDLHKIVESINTAEVHAVISESPTSYLCNEAYWHALNKFSGKAVLIHIPTIKHMDKHLTEALKQALEENNKTTLSKRPFSLEEVSKSELDAKLSHSYRQARSRQGKHVNDVFDAIDENHWN